MRDCFAPEEAGIPVNASTGAKSTACFARRKMGASGTQRTLAWLNVTGLPSRLASRDAARLDRELAKLGLAVATIPANATGRSQGAVNDGADGTSSIMCSFSSDEELTVFQAGGSDNLKISAVAWATLLACAGAPQLGVPEVSAWLEANGYGRRSPISISKTVKNYHAVAAALRDAEGGTYANFLRLP